MINIFNTHKQLIESKNLLLFQIKEEIVPALEFIVEHFKNKNNIVFMEIGLAFGTNFTLLGKVFSSIASSVFGIGVDLPAKKRWKDLSYDVHDAVEMCEVNFPYGILIGSSRSKDIQNKVLNILSGRNIDLLFIDGDHSDQGCKSDFNNYFPMVSENGLIIFHDIRGQKHGAFRVHDFWNKIKKQYKHKEFCTLEDNNGIGILVKKQCKQ